MSAGITGDKCVVAIAGGYATETNKWNGQWANDLTRYAQANGAYWDAVAMHFYPRKSAMSDFNDSIMMANEALANGTDKYAATFANTAWGRGKKMIVSEYCVTFDDKSMNGSLYGGIFSAEYIMRMSQIPSIVNVALHELTNQVDGIGAPPNAINGQGNWGNDLKAAGRAGRRVDTTGQIRGLYYNAQIIAVKLANDAVNSSDYVYKTSLWGGANVNTKSGSIPALFGAAYHAKNGRTEILLTNKSGSDIPVYVQYDGQTSGAPFNMNVVSGNPTDHNTADSQPVRIQTSQVRNPIMVPKFSVVHLEQ